MWNIILYHMGEPKIKVDKSPEEIGTTRGTLKNESAILNPVILLDYDLQDIRFCNYVFITAFNRYYFVEDIVSIRKNIVELHCHVDVLKSYATHILRNEAIVKRNEGLHNLNLNDGFFKIYQNPNVVVYEFENGFTTHEWVLAMAGNTGGIQT